MGLFAFLKSMLAPASSSAPAAPLARSAPASMHGADAPAIVARTEILDARNRLCGYRFAVAALDGQPALSEPQVLDTLVAADVPGFAQRRLALVPLSVDAVVFQRHLPLVAPHTVFLLDNRQANLPPPQLASRMAALRDSGCQVGLRGITSPATLAPMLAVCDLAVLVLGDYGLAEFQALAHQLRTEYPRLKLLVEGVDSWDEQRMCLEWGCSYCMGRFLTTADKIDPDARIDHGRLTSIELLNLLRSDAELGSMIEVAKRDPGITYQVLQWANAPAHGQTTRVTSLNQAFMVLGRNQLYRGLTVSMFRLGGGAQGERDESLLEVALRRARFLELVAPATLPAAQRDELFLVGLLSLFDVLLGMPMQQLLGQMHLSEDIRSVLLHSEGRYSPYLMLVLLLERDKLERALALARTLQIAPAALGPSATAAFQWAQESIGMMAPA